MQRLRGFVALAVVLAGSGCESATQVLNDQAAVAMQVAVRRGQFELACPTAAGTALSQNLLQPAAWRGQERAEFTIGVAGCGRRAVYVSVCQIGSPACFAAASPSNRSMQFEQDGERP